MDRLKGILESMCYSSSSYTYDKVDNLAEIYYKDDTKNPLAMIEWSRTEGLIVRFRIGITSRDVANLSVGLAIQESSIVFKDDFIVDPQYGYLYGEEATQAFITKLQRNMEQTQIEDAFNNATYISNAPVFAAGSNVRSRTKIEKIWDEDL